ncbi:hypothetical protein [Proteus hauseri]|uniref:hypothetical protein n=1 Tax=Proteus hauseri TaxID=183417 RepID=UPI0032DACEFF
MKEFIQLTIEDTQTTLQSQSEKMTLPIGIQQIDGYSFQHSPITPYEAEVAIEHIENVIIPARYKFSTDNPILQCNDIRLIHLFDKNNQTVDFLSTQHIENAFNELVNVINGSPINTTTLPVDKSFTAFLLILREISHHWQLSGITVKITDKLK